MNQAQLKNGKWVEVEERTDGIYANGVKIADPYIEEVSKDIKRIEIITL